MWKLDVPVGAEPIGYRFLVEHFKLEVLPHYRWSYVSSGWESKKNNYEHTNIELHIYPKPYQIEKKPIKHLEFALKQEGIHFGIIKQTLSKLGVPSITSYIKESPTGKYARKFGFYMSFC